MKTWCGSRKPQTVVINDKVTLPHPKSSVSLRVNSPRYAAIPSQIFEEKKVEFFGCNIVEGAKQLNYPGTPGFIKNRLHRWEGVIQMQFREHGEFHADLV